MSCFIYNDEEDSSKKINIDELFEKKQRRDLKQLAVYNKILNRVHKRITTVSRGQKLDTHIWFTVPEFIFGEPVYDNADCTGYLVANLEENGFQVKYMHPNTLFISWENWVPAYVRNQIKKKTGVMINEKGEVVAQRDDVEDPGNADPNSRILNDKTANNPGQKPGKQYTPIGQYKPTGNLVYNNELFEKLEKKVSFL